MKCVKATVCIIAMAYGLLTLLAMCKPADDFSVSERRKLAGRPEFSIRTVQDGTFMSKTEEYVTDQFPFRDAFRGIKAMFSKDILKNRDSNGIYYKDGYLAKMEYPMNIASIDRAVGIFHNINEKYLEGTEVNTYFCIIPDKNCFLADDRQLSMDYKAFEEYAQKKMSFADSVSIMKELEIADYYRTDTHWRQEKIMDVVGGLAAEMKVPYSGNFEYREVESPFYGVYYGQAALPMEPDTIGYCRNEILDACTLYDYENRKEVPLYDVSKAEGRDPYELFFGGNISLATINSPKALSDKELIVFGDSFSRSLLPLLADGYKKVTLIDIRYMSSMSVGNFVEFTNQDVLFLYSTSVLNNSVTLK